MNEISRKDSGYITVANGLPILKVLLKNDSFDINNSSYKLKDTIGKYYKMEHSFHYIFMINDITNSTGGAESEIIECDTNGNILKTKLFSSGLYLCCWENYYDGLGKLGSYFYIKSCGTGSAFCGTDYYFFKDLNSDTNEVNEINGEYYYGMCIQIKNDFLACFLTSEIEAKAESLLFHYKYETAKVRKSGNYKILKTEIFDVEYKMINDQWIASDSSKLKDKLF